MNTPRTLGPSLLVLLLLGATVSDAAGSTSDRMRAKAGKQARKDAKADPKDREPAADVLPEVKPMAIVGVDIHPVTAEPTDAVGHGALVSREEYVPTSLASLAPPPRIPPFDTSH